MSLKPVNYISLSALSYIEFNSSMRNKTVEYLVNNKLIKEDNLSNPELSALKSSSNPLRSYILLDYTSTPSGFQAAAFQSPSGEIVFSFKGTDAGNGSEFSKDIANADEQIFTGSSKGLPAQFVDAENFVMPILRSNPDVKCSFTGHSLGGAIAQYMTYRTIYKSVTFNAPGIGEVIESATGDKIDYEFYKDIATNYANESDIVGNYRDYARIGGNILISSSVNPEVAADRDAYNRTIQLMIRKRNTYSYTNDEVRIMSEGIAAGKRLRDRGLFYNHSMSSLMDSDGKLMPVSSGKPLGDQFMIELVTGASIAYSGARDTILFIGNFIADSIWSSYSFLRAVFSGDLNNVFDLFKNASVAAKVDPLIFDLNGDGIRTTSLDDSTAYFDLDGDGFAEKVAWVGDGDGLLTLDRNGDGMVTNGQELFGDRTRLINGEYATSGFEALREFDDNNDGKIDTKDNVYSKLKMWQDINHDGLSQPEELKSLVDLGIVSIGLESTVTGAVDVMNNIQRRLSSFMKSDGSTAQVGEYLLNRDAVDSRDIFGESIVVPKDILLLPNMQGAGRVSSLHVSMAKDESGQLKAMVVDFVNANNAENRNRLFTEILYKWTGVDGLDPASRGGLIDARQLGVLEKFMGTDFVGNNGANPNSNAAPLLQKAYDKLVDRLYAMIASSSYLKKLIDKIDFKVDESGIEVDFLGVEKDIDKRIEEDSAAGINILGDFLRTIYGFGLNYKSNIDQFCNYFAAQSPELARIVYSSNKDAIVGDKNSQSLYGSSGSDVIYGDAGDDTLIGNTGNDTLIGGQGKDTLRGGYGDDTYIFNKGDGVDYIEEERGDNDTIQFGEGITLKDLKFFRYDSSGRNLYITVGDNGDAISIKNYFNDGSYSRPTDTFKVEKLLFSDGTTIDAAYIYEQVRTITGSRDGNTLIGHDDQDNILHGLDGNDTIYGGTGNDLLYGDAGDDTLIGNTGNDTLIGGQGKDTLRGGYGDDTYIFNKGDGVDRIYDMNGLADEVRLKHKLQDVIFERRSDDLVVYMPGSLDSVVIDSWYRGDNYKIETFTSEDGKFITHTQIESLIQAMSTFQKDTGMTWQQALSSQPSQVESIVTQYWTAPTA